MMNSFNKYDVVYGIFPDSDGSSKQSGYRPGIIIQNNIGNKYSPTLLAIPLTSRIKKINQPTHMLVKSDRKNGLRTDSMLLAEQITAIDKENVKKIGHISDRNVQRNIFKCFIHSAAYGNDDDDLKELMLGEYSYG